MALGFDPISAGVGVVGNIVSGILGNNAANKAAKLQEQAGYAAADRTNKTTQNVNTDLIAAGNTTGDQLRQAAGEGITRNDEQTLNANKLLDPYRESGDVATGQLTTGLAPGGDFNKAPTLADLQMDPGYAFRAAQATKAYEGSAAARGAATGGGATRDILALNSNLAAQDYQNAFNRFETSTQNRFNNVNTVAARGTQVAGTQGTNLINGGQFDAGLNYRSASDAGAINFGAAQQAGQNSLQGTREANDYITGGVASRAAGIVGGANALGQGFGGAANAVVGQRNLTNLLKNPALRGPYNPTYAANPLGGGFFGAGPQRP